MQTKLINPAIITLFFVTLNASYVILGAQFLLAAGIEHPITIALILSTVAVCVTLYILAFAAAGPKGSQKHFKDASSKAKGV